MHNLYFLTIDDFHCYTQAYHVVIQLILVCIRSVSQPQYRAVEKRFSVHVRQIAVRVAVCLR